MDPDVPLIVPQVNSEDLKSIKKNIIEIQIVQLFVIILNHFMIIQN